MKKQVEVLKTKHYFMWSGGTIVVLTIIISLLSGLYSEYFYCKNFEKENIEEEQNRAISGGTTADAQIEYLQNLDTKIKCGSVSNNIYTSYIAIVIGISLVIGGFITNKGVVK